MDSYKEQFGKWRMLALIVGASFVLIVIAPQLLTGGISHKLAVGERGIFRFYAMIPLDLVIWVAWLTLRRTTKQPLQ